MKSRLDTLNEYLLHALEHDASDLHLTVGLPPLLRLNGSLQPFTDEALDPDTIREIAFSMLTDAQRERLESHGEIDFTHVISHVSRFRVNIFRQRKSYAVSARVIRPFVPTLDALFMPSVLKDIALRPRGIFLVTGPTGSGKSTTLAGMVEHINQTRACHIITLEDPIEYLFRHELSMINQREVGDDTKTFASGLRSCLREDPDVILVGEMRDHETIGTAVTAAETGHFVMSTLHTVSAASTIDRIIDSFPPYQQPQIRVQLASTLVGILSQQLIPLADANGRIAALELLIVTDGVRNMIREGKTHQIDSVMQTNMKMGMVPMDHSLAQLVKTGRISYDEANARCHDPEMLMRYMTSN